MNLREARQVIGSLETDPDAARAFGEVHETADGTTVIPVTNVQGDNRFALRAKAAGVFVVKDGKAAWVPAVDAGRRRDDGNPGRAGVRDAGRRGYGSSATVARPARRYLALARQAAASAPTISIVSATSHGQAPC